MSRIRVLLVLLTTFITGCAGAEVRYPSAPVDTAVTYDTEATHDVEDVSVFYDALAPYGDWLQVPEYGQVWAPREVPVGWRPYTDGRWVYSDYGWTWVSDWEWGWAPFHYGRWTHVTVHGWVWVPGTVWAPAWVAWRHGPGWAGWAPLPPHVAFSSGGVIAHVDIPHFWFAFVEERWLAHPHVHVHVAPPARNVTLIHVTQNVTHYTVVNKRVINRGIPVQRIERVTARPVLRHHVVQYDEGRTPRRTVVKDKEREVVVYRPRARTVPHRVGTTVPQSIKETPPSLTIIRQKQQPDDAPTTLHPMPSQQPELLPERPQKRQAVVPRGRREQDKPQDTPTGLQPTPGQPGRLRSLPLPQGELPERPQKRQVTIPRQHNALEPRLHQVPGQGQGQPPAQPRPLPQHDTPRARVIPRQSRQLSESPQGQQTPVPQSSLQPATPRPTPAQRLPQSHPSLRQPSPQPAYTPQRVAPSAQRRQVQRHGRPSEAQPLQQQ